MSSLPFLPRRKLQIRYHQHLFISWPPYIPPPLCLLPPSSSRTSGDRRLQLLLARARRSAASSFSPLDLTHINTQQPAAINYTADPTDPASSSFLSLTDPSPRSLLPSPDLLSSLSLLSIAYTYNSSTLRLLTTTAIKIHHRSQSRTTIDNPIAAFLSSSSRTSNPATFIIDSQTQIPLSIAHFP